MAWSRPVTSFSPASRLDRELTTVAHPDAMQREAIARPIPLVDPVTMTTRWSAIGSSYRASPAAQRHPIDSLRHCYPLTTDAGYARVAAVGPPGRDPPRRSRPPRPG